MLHHGFCSHLGLGTDQKSVGHPTVDSAMPKRERTPTDDDMSLEELRNLSSGGHELHEPAEESTVASGSSSCSSSDDSGESSASVEVPPDDMAEAHMLEDRIAELQDPLELEPADSADRGDVGDVGLQDPAPRTPDCEPPWEFEDEPPQEVIYGEDDWEFESDLSEDDGPNEFGYDIGEYVAPRTPVGEPFTPPEDLDDPPERPVLAPARLFRGTAMHIVPRTPEESPEMQ